MNRTNPARAGLFRSGTAETGRVEAFSDGVLAIVITLLVLEIHVPQARADEATLWRALLALTPMIGAWVVSFLFVLVFWVAHHYLFAQLANVDRGLLWLNGLFLLCICFTPFPAALEAAYAGTRPAAFLLSLAMFLTAATFSLLRWYACFAAGLTKPEILPDALQVSMRRSLLAPTLYLLGVISSFKFVWLSLAIQVLVPVIFFFPSRAGIPDQAREKITG